MAKKNPKKFSYSTIAALLIVVASVVAIMLFQSSNSSDKTGQAAKMISNIACTDSDGGMDPYVKGTVTITGSHRRIRETSYIDDCDSSSSVTEYYCSNKNSAASVMITCANGYSCSDGACVILPDNPPTVAIQVDGRVSYLSNATVTGNDDIDVAELTVYNSTHLAEIYSCEGLQTTCAHKFILISTDGIVQAQARDSAGQLSPMVSTS